LVQVNWTAVYQNEPCGDVPDSLCPLILGGHGEMWGEHVDISDLESTVWPKLAAIAEKLWSPRAFTTASGAVSAARPRIERFRCLLNARGVRAAPVNNADAREAASGPGSCYQ
jgi:hexosaminidase